MPVSLVSYSNGMLPCMNGIVSAVGILYVSPPLFLLIETNIGDGSGILQAMTDGEK